MSYILPEIFQICNLLFFFFFTLQIKELIACLLIIYPKMHMHVSYTALSHICSYPTWLWDGENAKTHMYAWMYDIGLCAVHWTNELLTTVWTTNLFIHQDTADILNHNNVASYMFNRKREWNSEISLLIVHTYVHPSICINVFRNPVWRCGFPFCIE